MSAQTDIQPHIASDEPIALAGAGQGRLAR